jgi:hypothetical protein
MIKLKQISSQILAQFAEMLKLLVWTLWSEFEPWSLYLGCVNFQWLIISSIKKN